MNKLINFIALFIVLLTACTDSPVVVDTEPEKPDLLGKPSMFLKNVVIDNDTVFLDKNFDTDCRVEIPGYKINSIRLKVKNVSYASGNDTSVFSMNMFRIQYNNEFVVSAVVSVTDINTSERSTLVSKPFVIKAVVDLYNLYVRQECVDGKLKLSWPMLDKSNTKSYIVEKYVDENLIQRNEVVGDSCFMDPTYVGEEVRYKILTVNTDDVIQRTFEFIKTKEMFKFITEQHPVSGYTLKWRKNKYYSNFKDYNLILVNTFTGDKTIMTSENVNDTSLYMPVAPFGGELSYYLVQSPKTYPPMLTENQKNIYNRSNYGHFGIPGIRCDAMVVLDQNTFAYTRAGKIYKYNILENKTTDSIVNTSGYYRYLHKTPAGKYIYANNTNVGVTSFDFWKSDKFTNAPFLTFDTSYHNYGYTDELTGVGTIQNSTNLKYYLTTRNIQTNEVIYEAEAKDGGGNYISSNGEYLIGHCYLLRFKDNKWTKVWEVPETGNYNTFYSFDPQDPTRFYFFNNYKFSIISLIDYTVLKTYTITGSINTIDFNTKLMLVSVSGKVLVMNVDTGEVVKEIVSDNYELFGYDYCTKIIGNVLYSSQGVKYVLK